MTVKLPPGVSLGPVSEGGVIADSEWSSDDDERGVLTPVSGEMPQEDGDLGAGPVTW